MRVDHQVRHAYSSTSNLLQQSFYSMETIRIADNSLKYILFQRTDYLENHKLRNLLRQIGRIRFLHKLTVHFEAVCLRNVVKQAFSEDITQEYNKIKPYLPPSATSILDIGCGVAGIDIFVSRHYENKADIVLLDKSIIDKKLYYGYEAKGCFYNSLLVAKNLLVDNGVDPKKIHLLEPTGDNKIEWEGTFDIIISLLSWGFHYPVSTYLNQVYENLSRKGIAILDVRKNTGGKEEIEYKFGNSQVICSGLKFIRILAQKL